MKLFGTDGIRGTINTPQMSAPLAMHVAIAIGMRRREQAGDFRPEVLIAKGYASVGVYVGKRHGGWLHQCWL